MIPKPEKDDDTAATRLENSSRENSIPEGASETVIGVSGMSGTGRSATASVAGSAVLAGISAEISAAVCVTCTHAQYDKTTVIKQALNDLSSHDSHSSFGHVCSLLLSISLQGTGAHQLLEKSNSYKANKFLATLAQGRKLAETRHAQRKEQTFVSSVLAACSAFLRAFSASALCRFSRCSASSASRCFSSSSIISVFTAAMNISKCFS